MSHHFDQTKPPVAYPPQPALMAPVAPLPSPPGYPAAVDADQNAPATMAVETKSRGDGFWKGCCAALCCCCLLDACF